MGIMDENNVSFRIKASPNDFNCDRMVFACSFREWQHRGSFIGGHGGTTSPEVACFLMKVSRSSDLSTKASALTGRNEIEEWSTVRCLWCCHIDQATLVMRCWARRWITGQRLPSISPDVPVLWKG